LSQVQQVEQNLQALVMITKAVEVAVLVDFVQL
jgi:hypothetical protein